MVVFQTPRSPYMIYPYYVMLWGGFAGSMYMMSRMLLVGFLPIYLLFNEIELYWTNTIQGHKTWFSKG